jgi:Rad3-related DNA helicase
MKILDGTIDTYYNLEYVPRQQQIDGLNFLKDSIYDGKKYMLLNLPTGVGKSFLTNMFIIWYLNNVNSEAKFDVLTNSKILQKQYIKEFPYIRNLEGRSNYKCYPHLTNCEEGMVICKAKKKSCNTCPYLIALSNYINSRISLTNFHMFNISYVYSASIKTARESNVLIVDEASDFENVFSDYLTTEFNLNSFIKCGFDSDHITEFKNMLDEINELEDFIEYKDFIVSSLAIQESFLKSELESPDDTPVSLSKDMIKKYNSQLSECTSKLNSINIFIAEYENDKQNWVLDVNLKYDKKTKKQNKTLIIQPVWVHKYLPKYLLEKYDHVIFMSATILDKKLFCNINGLPKNDTTYFEISSPFPIENRKVFYIKNIGKMSYSNKLDTYINQKKMLNKILQKYSNDKGIIHTSNYEIANWIQRDFLKLYGDRLIFHETEDRNLKLDSHIDRDDASVLVSPSMISGVDLKNELSRFQIIMKMPYPNLQSKKYKKRLETYSDWYHWKTCVDLIQSVGRSVRSETDYADTFILDSCLSDLLKNYNKFLPTYFTDAIKILNL